MKKVPKCPEKLNNSEKSGKIPNMFKNPKNAKKKTTNPEKLKSSEKSQKIPKIFKSVRKCRFFYLIKLFFILHSLVGLALSRFCLLPFFMNPRSFPNSFVQWRLSWTTWISEFVAFVNRCEFQDDLKNETCKTFSISIIQTVNESKKKKKI